LADARLQAEGIVRRRGSVLDPEDRTLPIWVELVGDIKLRLPVGMLAHLALVIAEPPATLAVPRSALIRDGKEQILFVRRDDGTFEQRAVRTGRADDRFVEITGGLGEGEPVVIRGAAELQTAYAALK
jgi:multidrug efflux pump subunit AcrA (membrane-fusion protein)